MKTAIRITGIHFLLITLFGILANIDAASWCNATCNTVSYYGALIFLLLVYPGLKIAMQLIPFNRSESLPVTIWLAGAIATEVMLFIIIYVLNNIVTRIKNERA